MNSLDVIALPGQPGMFARRVAVQAWQSAGSPRANSAGRLYAEQKRLYDGWRLRKPGFQPADNPDNESLPLAHVRFVAFDIDPTAERIRRLTAAGFHRPYTYEPWHWELPNAHSYALVRSIPAFASLDVTPIAEQEEEEEDDMLKPKLIKRTEGDAEWSLCAPWLVGPGIQQGYIVTDNQGRATAWARLYDRGFGNETATNRDGYVAMQDAAREIRKQWLAAQPATATATASGPTAAQNAAAVVDAITAQYNKK